MALATGTQAQIIQQWTYQSDFGESSAAVAMDEHFMFVADNEDETLRLYARVANGPCAAPIYAFNARPYLTPATSNPEADLESAVKVDDASGTRIYWLGSHSNSKTGKSRPDRNRLFATQVTGSGTGSTPYALSYLGRYDHLRVDLVAWDQNNRHGQGANCFGLAASTYAASSGGVLPTRIDGFNLEGLVMAPDGTTAYLAFRAPLVNGSGPTTAAAQRTNALIVPLLNMPALVNGTASAAQFGTPFTLNLGGRGIRSIDSSYPGHYLITAGPCGDTSNPPIAPYNFCLFTWTGQPSDAPILQSTEFPYGLSPEGAMLPAGPITSGTVAQFVSDDEGQGGCWRSVTAYVVAPVPMLTIVFSAGHAVISWPASAVGFRLQYCTDAARKDWADDTTPMQTVYSENRVTEPASGFRLYRLMKP
jgi:hypothetical protein